MWIIYNQYTQICNNDDDDKNETVVSGIDVGTTFSAAAYVHNNKITNPYDIENSHHDTVIPSIYYIDDKGNVTIGDLAKKYLRRFPKHTFYDTKRTIGVKLSNFIVCYF